jgi:uncharacterized protein YndB with AHSA1/START domain
MRPGSALGPSHVNREPKERQMNRILGSLRTDDGNCAVCIEDRLDPPARDVWSALTDPARLAEWLGEVEGDLRPGGQFRALFVASGWTGTGRIEVCEPQERLLVVTRDADDPGPEFGHAIEVTLTADGEGTLVAWEERGMPPEYLAAYGAGIQVHVEDLASHLAGGGRCDAEARFDELLPAYEDLAAAVG